jgi:uncharacterized protein
VEPASPTTADERVELLDQLRGLAVFGILFVNLIFMAQPLLAVMRNAVPLSELDRAARAVIYLFFHSKFISMFSLLFGAGLFLMGDRAERRGARFGRVAVRRYLALMVLGAAHGVLLWCGDILSAYALLAFLLLAFRRRQPRTIVYWIVGLGVLLVLAGAALTVYLAIAGSPRPDPVSFARFLRALAAESTAYSSGSFLEVLRQRAKDYLIVVGLNLQTTPVILSMFLWGLFLAKKGWLADPDAHAPKLRRLFIVSFVIGAPAAIFHAARSFFDTPTPMTVTFWQALDGFIVLVGGMALALAYTSGIALLSRSPRWRARLAFLAPVGRMALTNYLAESLLVTLLFNSYGLGLFGKVSYAGGFAITLAVCTLLVFTSRWWFTRFHFGPVEWLWRSVTYWTLPPMRKR